MIDFHLSETQQAKRRAAADFASQVLKEANSVYAQQTTQQDRFRALRSFYRTAVSVGQVKGLIPVPLGGDNTSFLDAAIMLEEMYASDPNITLTVAGTGLGLMPLMFSQESELQQKFLAPFLTGDGNPLASLVHSEPGGTANWLEPGARGLQTVARKEGADWLITGEKLWATNSGGWDVKGADLQCVVCRQDHESQSNGMFDKEQSSPADSIIILLVTRDIIAHNDADAYTVIGEPELAGMTATSGPHSRFKDLRVPGANVLATGDTAVGLIEQSFTATAALVGTFSVSIMRAAFEAALNFARTDSRGGTVPIIERQAVADKLSDIKMRTDACRVLTWKALHCLENGPGDFKARQELCLETKVFTSESCVKSVTDAMAVVGMTSYRQDQPLAKLLNDAMCLPLFDGGNLGIRRRQMEEILKRKEYSPWSGFY